MAACNAPSKMASLQTDFHLALDTEFTNLDEPELLSLALSHVEGPAVPSLYLELDLTGSTGTTLLPRCNEFVRQTVLPQFGIIPQKVGSYAEMSATLEAWLRRWLPLGGYVSYDSSIDMRLLEKLWQEEGSKAPPSYEWGLLLPSNLSILNEDETSKVAREQCWKTFKSEHGVGMHHALADAHALACAFRAQSH